MFKSGSTKLVRDLNKQHILNLVRMHSGITAREISNTTGLQMSTVLYTLRALKEEGLVKETGYGSPTLQGGKPPLVWDIAEDYGFVLGIELLSKEIRLVLLNFNAGIVFKNIYPVNFSKNAEQITQQVIQVVRKVLNEQNIAPENVLGLGLGIPGSIDHDQGIIRFSYSFDFHNVPFRKMLQEQLIFPVEIDNDANAGALGIKWLSRNEFFMPDILYVSIHQNFSGMGLGFIINHELYRGGHGAAGEIGSFLPAGTWQRFLKRAGEKFVGDCNICLDLQKNNSQVPSVSLVVKNAKAGDRGSIFVLYEVAKEISKKIVQLVDLFDPEVIVIGGDICDAREFIETIIKERIPANVISECTREVPLRFSPFGAYSGAMGSTALIFQKIFS